VSDNSIQLLITEATFKRIFRVICLRRLLFLLPFTVRLCCYLLHDYICVNKRSHCILHALKCTGGKCISMTKVKAVDCQ